MKIYLIRHGQTTGDIENRYGGSYDDHLTYTRLNYNRSNKGWDIDKVYKNMNKTIEAFYLSLGPREKDWIMEFYKQYGLDVQNLGN